MLQIIENRSSFTDSELVMLAKRDNNSRRNYLLIDSKQGKHIPADPSHVLKLFRELAGQMKAQYGSEKILFIGFAETATAVGAEVASCFEGSYYVHTTREVSENEIPVAEFREEHSHAAEQRLYCKNWKDISEQADRIVFAEDEVTTARTIMNLINELRIRKAVRDDMKFSVCSVLNGVSDSRLSELNQKGIDFFWLVRLLVSPDSDTVYRADRAEVKTVPKKCTEIRFSGKNDPRFGTKTEKYISDCRKLASEITARFDFKGMHIAVIGTEECVYPALCTADMISSSVPGCTAVTHSSTRTPIVADVSEGYPVRSGYQVESFYEEGRRNFIYNTDENYDLVIIITDSEKRDISTERLLNAFTGCSEFVLVRWSD